jgi:hypothetical protein
MEPLKINLRIEIPSDTCDCDAFCMCRLYVKCNNGCFCGNQTKIYQKKSVHGPLTPDYSVTRLYKLKKQKVSFGPTHSKHIDPLVFKPRSPNYLLIKEINKKFKNNFLSPQHISKKRKLDEDEIITPLSV